MPEILNFSVQPASDEIQFQQLASLHSLMRTSRGTVLIRLGCGRLMSASAGLQFADLVAHGRSRGLTVITDSFTPLFGAAAFAWLQGDVRGIYPSGYIYIYSLDSYREHLLRGPLSEPTAFCSPLVEQEIEDYRGILDRLGEYIEVESVLDRRVGVAALREANLLDLPMALEVDNAPAGSGSPIAEHTINEKRKTGYDL